MRLGVLMSLASPWARETAAWLSQLGHEVHVVDFARPLANSGWTNIRDEFHAESIASLRNSVASLQLIETPFSSSLRYFASFLQLRRLLDACKAQALLTLYGGGFATMAFLSSFRPYAVYVVGSDVLLMRGSKRMINRISLSSAQLVLANGSYLAQRTREAAPRACVVSHYLGVDVNKFSRGTPVDGTTRIVCTRGFAPIYNNEYLIQALPLMPTSTAEFTVTFMSSGPSLDSARALAGQVLPATMRRQVQFLGGVPAENLVEKLKSADIYVSLSRSDGTSTSLLEAMACGLFPVLSDIPANREWISEEAGNGVLVPLDQPEALAKTLNDVVSDPGRRKRASEYNRQLVLEHASKDRQMESLASRLEEMVNSSPNK